MPSNSCSYKSSFDSNLNVNPLNRCRVIFAKRDFESVCY